jgi:hypothetical protein
MTPSLDAPFVVQAKWRRQPHDTFTPMHNFRTLQDAESWVGEGSPRYLQYRIVEQFSNGEEIVREFE